jgi:hypothetical protein
MLVYDEHLQQLHDTVVQIEILSDELFTQFVQAIHDTCLPACPLRKPRRQAGRGGREPLRISPEIDAAAARLHEEDCVAVRVDVAHWTFDGERPLAARAHDTVKSNIENLRSDIRSAPNI